MHTRDKVIELIEEEAGSGFPRLAGARVSGTLRITQAALNDKIRHLRQVPPGVALDVRAGNEVAVRYGLLQATAVVDEAVELSGGPPRIRLVLASGLVAVGLRVVLRGPAMFVDGRRLTIDLAALDPAGKHRHYWPLLRRVRLRTTPGQVHVEFEAAV
jgi:hypothetical protein